MVSNTQSEGEENSFVEFRRKVRAAEMLSTVAAAPVYGPAQRRGAKRPRAEIQLWGGLLSAANDLISLAVDCSPRAVEFNAFITK
jgi:hypothetical protein